MVSKVSQEQAADTRGFGMEPVMYGAIVLPVLLAFPPHYGNESSHGLGNAWAM